MSLIVAVDPSRDRGAPAVPRLPGGGGTPPVEVVMVAGADGHRRAEEPEPVPVRWIECPARSLGARWNAGADAAQGRLLVFLRAGAVLDPRLVACHIEAHANEGAKLVIGRLSARDGESIAPSAAVAPLEALGNTLSLTRDTFARDRGFDTELTWGPEVEYSFRAATRGIGLQRCAATVGRLGDHQPDPDEPSQRYAAGRGSVELYRHTPAMLPWLELGTFQAASPRAIATRRLLLALGGPPLPGGLGAGRGRLQGPWRRFTRDYQFWRGVRDNISAAEWRSLAWSPVILMYHAIGGPGEPAGRYILPAHRFARQLAWLRARGYRVLPLSELLEYRRRNELPPARSVVITFDDGYADNFELAYPILRRQRAVATFFLVSGSIGGRNGWDDAGELAGRPLVSWASAREMLAGGMEIGAHTRRHPALPELGPAEIVDEVAGSRCDLELGLGQPVRTFAYPFGRVDEAVAAAVRDAGYDGACCSRSGANDPAVSALWLRRVEVRGTDSLMRFALLVRRGRSFPRRRA